MHMPFIWAKEAAQAIKLGQKIGFCCRASGPPRSNRPRSKRTRSIRIRSKHICSNRPRSDRTRSKRTRSDRPRSDRPRSDRTRSKCTPSHRTPSDRTRSKRTRSKGTRSKGTRSDCPRSKRTRSKCPHSNRTRSNRPHVNVHARSWRPGCERLGFILWGQILLLGQPPFYCHGGGCTRKDYPAPAPLYLLGPSTGVSQPSWAPLGPLGLPSGAW